MAEGKTITIIQKGKAVQETVTVKVTVSNMASPVITGATQNSISHLSMSIVYIKDGNIIDIPTGWKTQFGRTQSVTVEVNKGSDVQIIASAAHYIPGQNIEAVPGYLCTGDGPYGNGVINNIQENVDLVLTISPSECR